MLLASLGFALSGFFILWGEVKDPVEVPVVLFEVPPAFPIMLFSYAALVTAWIGWVLMRQSVDLMRFLEFSLKAEPHLFFSRLSGASFLTTSTFVMNGFCVLGILLSFYNSAFMAHPLPIFVITSLPFFLLWFSPSCHYLIPQYWDRELGYRGWWLRFISGFDPDADDVLWLLRRVIRKGGTVKKLLAFIWSEIIGNQHAIRHLNPVMEFVEEEMEKLEKLRSRVNKPAR